MVTYRQFEILRETTNMFERMMKRRENITSMDLDLHVATNVNSISKNLLSTLNKYMDEFRNTPLNKLGGERE